MAPHALVLQPRLAVGGRPSAWKSSVVVPLLKRDGDPCSHDSYRPISLASCAFEVFEHLVHARIAPHLFSQLDECQGGFRWGADVMAYSLLDSVVMCTLLWRLLTSGKHSAAWCACATSASQDACGTLSQISCACSYSGQTPLAPLSSWTFTSLWLLQLVLRLTMMVMVAQLLMP